MHILNLLLVTIFKNIQLFEKSMYWIIIIKKYFKFYYKYKNKYDSKTIIVKSQHVRFSDKSKDIVLCTMDSIFNLDIKSG